MPETEEQELEGLLEAAPEDDERVGAWASPLGAAAERLRSARGVAIGVAALAFFLVGFVWADVSLPQVLVIGIRAGAVYSLIGLGLALVYKATRVLNFAQGELGTVPAFVAYAIMVGFDWSDTGPPPSASRLWWAAVIAVAVGVALAILVNAFVVQRLADTSGVTTLVATAGVALLLTSTEVVMFEAKLRPFPRFVDGNAFKVGNTPVEWHTVIVVLVLAGAALALAAFFRSPPGVALLATAQEPFAAELSGVSVRTMSLLAWGAAGALGAIGGLLGAGVFTNLRPGLMTTTFLIPAFTGAVLGGLTSMVGAVVGGLLLGMVVAYANELFLSLEFLRNVPGPPQIAILTVLLVVLLVRPRGLFGREA